MTNEILASHEERMKKASKPSNMSLLPCAQAVLRLRCLIK